MGILEKVKSAAKSADSYAGEAVDKSKYKSKIKEANNEIDKLYGKLGKLYYDNRKNKQSAYKDEAAEICDKIEEQFKKIEEFENCIDEVSESAKKERAEIKAEAKAESEAKAKKNN